MMWSCPGFGGGFSGMGWMMAFNGIFWVAILVLGFVLVLRLVGHRPAAAGASGLAVLEERYARGEIGRDEYLEKRGDLTGRKG